MNVVFISLGFVLWISLSLSDVLDNKYTHIILLRGQRKSWLSPQLLGKDCEENTQKPPRHRDGSPSYLVLYGNT